LGVWNSVQVAGTVLNSLGGLGSLYLVAKDHEGFLKYLNKNNNQLSAIQTV